MEYLKPFLPKETLLDTTFLLISIFFIKIGLLYIFYAFKIFIFLLIYNFHFFHLN